MVIEANFKSLGNLHKYNEELLQFLSEELQTTNLRILKPILPDVDFLLFKDITNLWTVSVSTPVNSKFESFHRLL